MHQYRDHDGFKYFVGDPVAYGWDGEKHAYYGHHPIPVDALVDGDPDTEWCYIDGPHYHAWAPPPDVKRERAAAAAAARGETLDT